MRGRLSSAVSESSSNINALSVKNIDGKILKHNADNHNVKFVSSFSNFKDQADPKIESPVKKQKNKVRKSILRCSGTSGNS